MIIINRKIFFESNSATDIYCEDLEEELSADEQKILSSIIIKINGAIELQNPKAFNEEEIALLNNLKNTYRSINEIIINICSKLTDNEEEKREKELLISAYIYDIIEGKLDAETALTEEIAQNMYEVVLGKNGSMDMLTRPSKTVLTLKNAQGEIVSVPKGWRNYYYDYALRQLVSKHMPPQIDGYYSVIIEDNTCTADIIIQGKNGECKNIKSRYLALGLESYTSRDKSPEETIADGWWAILFAIDKENLTEGTNNEKTPQEPKNDREKISEDLKSIEIEIVDDNSDKKKIKITDKDIVKAWTQLIQGLPRYPSEYMPFIRLAKIDEDEDENFSLDTYILKEERRTKELMPIKRKADLKNYQKISAFLSLDLHGIYQMQLKF